MRPNYTLTIDHIHPNLPIDTGLAAAAAVVWLVLAKAAAAEAGAHRSSDYY